MAKKKATPKKTTRKKKKVGRKSSNALRDFFAPTSTPFPEDLNDVDYKQMKQLNKAMNASRILWDLERIEDMIDSPNYKLNKWEQLALDELIEKYNTKYKSKLVKALG